MAAAQLISALKSVDWNANVSEFISDVDAVERFAEANLRIAIWAKQFETVDAKNPALVFVRGMQSIGQQVPVLTALAMYGATAAALRSLLENALYYTYFRTHPAELATLGSSKGYFIDKKTIIDFHKVHTPEFGECQNALGLITRLDNWYSKISAVVHNQIPGTWHPHKGTVSAIAPDVKTRDEVLTALHEVEAIVHHLLLCTAGKELWGAFSTKAKKKLLKGLPGAHKDALGLDSG